MNLANLNLPDLIGALLGFTFTLLVFSYIFGDNALFRIAIHIFIGVAAGYAASVAWYSVIWPQLVVPLLVGSNSERLFVLVPLVMGALLLTKVSPRLSIWGTPVMAYLVGVGMAVAIGGSIMGTIFPQVMASVNQFDAAALGAGSSSYSVQLINALVVLVGTVVTLIYFQFGARPGPSGAPVRPGWIEGIASFGRLFIAITLGTLFAGVYAAALAAFVERWHFIVNLVLSLIRP